MGKRAVVLVAAVTVATSVGCTWSQPGFDAGGSGYNWTERSIRPGNVASLQEEWTAPLDGAPGRYIVQSSRDAVHVVDEDAAYGVSLATGERMWRTPLAGLDAVTNPSADGRAVLVGTYDEAAAEPAQVQRLDAATGEIQASVALAQPADLGSLFSAVVYTVQSGPWSVSTASNHWNSPPNPGQYSSTFTVTDARRPEESWSSSTTGYGLGNPVIVGRRVYAVTHDLRLSLPIPNPILDTFTDVRLVGWDLDDPCAESCEPDFSMDLPIVLPGRISASQDGTTVFVPSGRQLRAVDLATGSIRWSGDVAGLYREHWAAPTVVQDQVFQLGPNTIEARAVDGCGTALCPPAWSTTLPGTSVGQAAAAGGLLFVGMTDGTVAAYPTSCSTGCAPAWSASVGSAVTAAPIVTGGRVIVGTADGRLVAFGLPAE
jgi:hypothetical protein